MDAASLNDQDRLTLLRRAVEYLRRNMAPASDEADRPGKSLPRLATASAAC